MKCEYPKCKEEIREEDKKLKPETAKLCEKHNRKLMKLVDTNDIPKTVEFMMKIAFENANK